MAGARELVFLALSLDPELNILGFNGNNIFTTHDVDTPQVRPLMVIRWGSTLPGMDVVNQRMLMVWVHDEPSNYARIDETLKRLRALLVDIEAVRLGSGSSGLHTIVWEGDSDDLRDVEIGTITRWARFRLIGSAL